MIPKILHQTYKHSGELPPIYKVCAEAAKKHHSDWEYRFWTDQDMYREVKEFWPDLWPAFQALPRQIMRIDVFRYCLMYKYGGLYADLDYFFVKPFDMLESVCILPKSRETRLGNCVFASEPGHFIWLEMIQDIIKNDRSSMTFGQDNLVCDSGLGTGPEFVTRIYNESENKSDIVCPARSVFHPEIDRKKMPEYLSGVMKPNGAYGFHICAGVWRRWGTLKVN